MHASLVNAGGEWNLTIEFGSKAIIKLNIIFRVRPLNENGLFVYNPQNLEYETIFCSSC